MIHINGRGYCTELGAQQAVDGLVKQIEKLQAENQEHLKLIQAQARNILDLHKELAASQSSHKALETLYLQVRDEELVSANTEIDLLKERLEAAKVRISELKQADIVRLQKAIIYQSEEIDKECARIESLLAAKDKEIARLKDEHEKYRDTLYSAKMMDKDHEIAELKKALNDLVAWIQRMDTPNYPRPLSEILSNANRVLGGAVKGGAE